MVENKLKDYYGPTVDTSKWATMPYLEVLVLKVKLANENIIRIQKASWRDYDINHVARCVAAIKFNENLISELPVQKSQYTPTVSGVCKDCMFKVQQLKCLTCSLTERVVPKDGYCHNFKESYEV